MTDEIAEAEPEEREDERVVEWRRRTLERAGYAVEDAGVLAADLTVDLHVAVALLEDGCPPEVALEILL